MIGQADLREAAIRAGISEVVIDELLGEGHMLVEDPEITLRLVIDDNEPLEAPYRQHTYQPLPPSHPTGADLVLELIKILAHAGQVTISIRTGKG